MAGSIPTELVLASEDQKFRWKIFVRGDGRLSVVELAVDKNDGTWKPCAGEKVIAWTDYQARVTH